ncbi:hypothetical protein SUGI_0313330 [Cryptomeria japonica]|nr:hypothetical protein SUGI_0313330 [Cryptomeria japonica]
MDKDFTGLVSEAARTTISPEYNISPQSNNGEGPSSGSVEVQPKENASESLGSQVKEVEQRGSMLGARGGPLFMPGLVSPYTSIPQFQASVTQQLTRLHEELHDDLIDIDEFDVSVDDLKIITDEELVDRVFKEAFKGSSKTQGLPTRASTESVAQNHVRSGEGKSQGEESVQEIQGNALSDTDLAVDTENISPRLQCHSALSTLKKKRRGRHYDRETRAAELESDEIQKAESLAKIKCQQEEDKANAKLHSLISKCRESTSTKYDNMERLKSLKFITSKLKTKTISQIEHEPVHYSEVVLCIEFYHNIRKEHKIQEFLVLGSQPLTVLRDKLYCLTDQLMQKAGQHVPSGYFLIENVFYNDFRDPMASDYSRPIINWFNNQRGEALEKWKAIIAAGFKKKQRVLLQESLPSDQLPFFRTTNMSTTCFADLQFQLGVRYLYCHQGDCKHGIVIRDMRLIHPEDVQNKYAYPLLTFQPRVRHRKCTICDIYRAKKITYDDKWAPENPSFFCENCYYLLHYNQDGTLMYDDFSVFDYHHE